MADDLDRASITQAVIVDAQIFAQRKAAWGLVTDNPRGVCLSADCQGVTGTERRFCDKLCAAVWERDNG